MVKKGIVALFLCLVSLFCLLSCGLEDFSYIHYVEYIDYNSVWQTTIRLPSSSEEGYSNFFTNFIIFYRIYISAEQSSGAILALNLSALSGINPQLLTDYNSLSSLLPSPSNTTVSTSNLETRFSNQRYYQLALEGEDINSVLGSGSLDKTLEIAFPLNPGERPTITLKTQTEVANNLPGTSHILKRVTSIPGLTFYPVPDDLSFLNFPDLYNTDNATREINADVNTNTGTGEMRYTYVSLYIAAKGKNDEMPPQDVFSQPNFVGTFILPETN